MSSNDSEIKEEIIDKEDLVTSSNLNEIPQFFEAEEKYNVKDEESVCNLIFVSKTDVDLDYLYIDENINDKFQCITCNKKFLDLQSLNQHSIICCLEKIDHVTKKCIICKFCDETYMSMKNLEHHIRAVHEGKKHFKCDTCEATFSHKKSLERHVTAIHVGKKPFKCDECDARFNYNQSLKNHISTVHEGIRYCCPFCKKEFTQKCELNIHVRDRCKATFVHKQDLNGHIISYPEGKKQFQCFSCKKYS